MLEVLDVYSLRHGLGCATHLVTSEGSIIWIPATIEAMGQTWKLLQTAIYIATDALK